MAIQDFLFAYTTQFSKKHCTTLIIAVKIAHQATLFCCADHSQQLKKNIGEVRFN